MEVARVTSFQSQVVSLPPLRMGTDALVSQVLSRGLGLGTQNGESRVITLFNRNL